MRNSSQLDWQSRPAEPEELLELEALLELEGMELAELSLELEELLEPTELLLELEEPLEPTELLLELEEPLELDDRGTGSEVTLRQSQRRLFSNSLSRDAGPAAKK